MLDEIPFLGVGLAFRQELKNDILSNRASIDFLELLTDQYIDMPPYKEQEARSLANIFPLVLHGVDLSIGTDTPIDEEYLNKMHQVADWINPKWVSEHLSYTRVPGLNIGQLTPLSFNERVVEIVVRNIKHVAKTFDCPFLIENISYYFHAPPSTMTEGQFITEVIYQADCGLLLDLTNVQNNAVNNKYDAYEFLNQIPLERVVQVHLAGGYYYRGILLDTHSHAVPPDVFDLLRFAAPRMNMLKAVTIERDQDFPPFQELLGELDQVREILSIEPIYNSASEADRE